jgi:hypothetical protein
MSIAFTTGKRGVRHTRKVGIKQIKPHAHDSELKTLSERLRFAIVQRGTNPNRIERTTGITRQTLYAALQGKTKAFEWPTLETISSHLGVSPDWLAEGRLPMHPAPELKEDDEIQLVYDFRAMSDTHRRDLAEIASRWAEEDGHSSSKSNSFHHSRKQ